ncbi:hypothetical protein BL254_17425 [Protofrankia sp. BMG5.30]|nr:hypothetical protein BL254_17425 [Protofrankia sp. BMG5.30]
MESAGSPEHGDEFPETAGAPSMDFEVHIIDGADGERLAHEQAKVIKDVLEWLDQQRSNNGRNRAA